MLLNNKIELGTLWCMTVGTSVAVAHCSEQFFWVVLDAILINDGSDHS